MPSITMPVQHASVSNGPGQQARPWLGIYPDGLPKQTVAEFTDMLSVFRESVRRHAQAPAILYFDGRLSFAELDRRSDALAAHLLAHGFKAGDRLALYMQNDPGFVIGLLGAWKAAGSAIVMNPMYRRREVEFLLADSGATAILCLDELYDTVVKEVITAGVTALRQVVVMSGCDHQTRNDRRVLTEVAAVAGLPKLADLVAVPPATRFIPAHPQPDDLAVLMYTSGTTGRPKGAMITQRAMAYSSQTYRDWIGLGSEDRILAVAPLFHITGLMGHVGASLMTGAVMIMNHRFEGGAVMDLIREHRPTFTVGSVTVFNNLANRADVSAADFASFRAVCSGGAPIAPALNDEIGRRTGIYLHNLYGMTETNGPAIGVPIGVRAPVDPTSGALAVGLPVFNTMVRIVDEDLKDLPYGEVGEILVAGPQVIPAYWNQPEESARRIRGNEISTGDVGFMDGQGWCYLVDRKTDMINSSGYKVWPREVEDVLYTHPAVKEAAVIGVADAYRGETVKAYVVLKSEATVSGQELIDYCKSQMAAYKYPRIVEFLDELPKSVTGKILRRELRSAAEP